MNVLPVWRMNFPGKKFECYWISFFSGHSKKDNSVYWPLQKRKVYYPISRWELKSLHCQRHFFWDRLMCSGHLLLFCIFLIQCTNVERVDIDYRWKNGIVEHLFKESPAICMEWIAFIVEYHCHLSFLKGFAIGYFSQDGAVFE